MTTASRQPESSSATAWTVNGSHAAMGSLPSTRQPTVGFAEPAPSSRVTGPDFDE